MIYKPRTAWQKPNQPVTGPSNVPFGQLKDVVYHYPGAGPSAAPWNFPVARLQAMQADYVSNRGYSLGYNWGIDLEGVIWEIRGFDIKCAATKGYNDFCVAIQFMLPGTQGANTKQLAAAVELHKEIERRAGHPLGVAGHFQRGTTATPCPGAGVIAQLPTIEQMVRFNPTPPVEDDMYNTVTIRVGPDRWDQFTLSRADNSVVHRWHVGGVWSDWENLGGSCKSAPDVVSDAQRLDVFVRGMDDHIFQNTFFWQANTPWSGWQDRGATP